MLDEEDHDPIIEEFGHLAAAAAYLALRRYKLHKLAPEVIELDHVDIANILLIDFEVSRWEMAQKKELDAKSRATDERVTRMR